MDTRQRIIWVSVVVVALVSAVAIGSAMTGSVQQTTMGPAQVATETPTPTQTTTVVTTTEDGEEGPSLTLSRDPSGGIEEPATVTFTAEVTRADGSPVEGAEVQYQSLRYQGEWTARNPATTDAKGIATSEWKFVTSDSEFNPRNMPPSESVSMIAEAEVDGQTVQTIITLTAAPNCYSSACHAEGEELA